MDLLIDGLRAALAGWKRDPGRNGDVVEMLRHWRLAEPVLRAHARFDPERYQRQRLYADGDFEVLLLCWDRGQATPIHDHDGQTGWITLVQGGLVVQEFERRGGPADLSGVAEDASLAPGSVALRAREAQRVEVGPTVCEAAAPETIHRVGSDGERALSLHVYARPLGSFVVFDEAVGSCRRVRCA